MEKRPNLSDKYQSLFYERSCSNDMMESFDNSDSISARLNPFEYNEDLMDLEEQLRVEFWRVVETLTKRRKQVIKLFADGYTRTEVAKKLKRNQSTTQKNYRGSSVVVVNEAGEEEKKFYGGSHKKLRLLIDADEKIQAILREMEAIRASKW